MKQPLTAKPSLNMAHYSGNVPIMPIARSRLTSQGQISVPAEVRRKLGLGPGSLLEWDEDEGKMIVRKAGQFSFEDMHAALFPDGPPSPRTKAEHDAALTRYFKSKYARR
jgi:AbrB family looped-hinge helix DNA binding protein